MDPGAFPTRFGRRVNLCPWRGRLGGLRRLGKRASKRLESTQNNNNQHNVNPNDWRITSGTLLFYFLLFSPPQRFARKCRSLPPSLVLIRRSVESTAGRPVAI